MPDCPRCRARARESAAKREARERRQLMKNLGWDGCYNLLDGIHTDIGASYVDDAPAALAAIAREIRELMEEVVKDPDIGEPPPWLGLQGFT